MKKTCCYDCGLEYGSDKWIEAIIPDKIWLKISPTSNDGGILCISCIAKRLKNIGLNHIPLWLCGTEPFDLQTGDPVENIKLLREFDINPK